MSKVPKIGSWKYFCNILRKKVSQLLLCSVVLHFIIYIFSNDRTTTTEKRVNTGNEIIIGDGTCTPSTRRSNKGQIRQPKDLIPRPPSGKKPASNSFREDTSMNIGLNSRPTSVNLSTMSVKTRPPSGKTRPMSGVKRKSIPSKKGNN